MKLRSEPPAEKRLALPRGVGDDLRQGQFEDGAGTARPRVSGDSPELSGDGPAPLRCRL